MTNDWLALRAKVRRTSGQPDPLDGGPAARARLPGPSVDAKLVLVLALEPGTADVVADAGAAALDRPVQHGRNGLPQPCARGGCRARARKAGIQAGLERRLVGVDVAAPRSPLLAQKHRLEVARGRRQRPPPVRRVEVERLRPQAGR